MFKGFYNLTSAMLSQGRRLDVVANNMTNVSTTGYKADQYTDSTFHEYVVQRVGQRDTDAPAELGPASYILAPSRVYTDHTQGALEETGMPLDFAIQGAGYFAIQTVDGVGYTRNGSFTLDEEGFLTLPGQGRVLDLAGQPMQLMVDTIQVDGYGAISDQEGLYLGQIGVYTFPDEGALQRSEQDLFLPGADQPQAEAVPLRWKAIERSNVELVQEMVDMITAQRALQSAAQLSKMYDQLMNKAANDLGRV